MAILRGSRSRGGLRLVVILALWQAMILGRYNGYPTGLQIPRQTEACGGLGPVAGHGLWKKNCHLKEFLILWQAGPCGRPQFLGRIMAILWDLWFRLNLVVILALWWATALRKMTISGLYHMVWMHTHQGDNNYPFKSVVYVLCFSILTQLQ